ncbi:mannosyl-oligosaccharide alpha-1-2-mannosidase 1B [Penicillium chermesinum]|nr:mannosyl-oligosaccharide alpha-1-2-mannosidase 1B [Penicillium chermesinum]
MVRVIPHALLALSSVIGTTSAASHARASSQSCNKVQYHFPAGTGKNDPRAEAVKQAYVREWNEYYKYAFPQDDLEPLTHNGTDDLFGWGASVVDGIDTAVVMGLTDIVEKQLKHIAATDFTKSATIVNFFDINIRYIGGLLSAYDLIKSGEFPNPYDQDLVEMLLTQATRLAKAISPVFETATGLPAATMNFTSGEVIQSTTSVHGKSYNSTNTAQAGTLILRAQKAEEYLLKPSPAPAFPGLVGTELDTSTGQFITFDGGWEAGVDSFIEYLIKGYVYDRDDTLYAIDEGFLLDEDGNIMWTMDDYACFAGGNLLLGGHYLDRPEITALGIKVADSCHRWYNATLTGLGPSSKDHSLYPCYSTVQHGAHQATGIGWYNASNQPYDPEYNNATYRAQGAKLGYFIEDPSYRSYPEPLESIFYAYRVTGDTRWQQYNWEIFNALDTARSKAVPYAEISDVNKPYGGTLINYVSSFYFAEVLKYLYLTFAEPDVVSLDKYVFNTECHPFTIKTPC